MTRSANNVGGIQEAERDAGADKIAGNVEDIQEKQQLQQKQPRSKVPKGVSATASGFGVIEF